MKGEWIDLLTDQLDDERAGELRARAAADPAAAAELAEASRVLALMARGERIEPSPAGAERLRAAARRATRPGLGDRLTAVAGLVRFRFRTSLAFRIALLSLVAHFVVLGLLWRVKVVERRPATVVAVRTPERAPDDLNPDDVAPLPEPIEPDRSFRSSLVQRRLPHRPRLELYGIDGQPELIRDGLERVLAGQGPDGGWGELRATALCALTLLAEGESSVHDTPRGRALRGAIGAIERRLEAGEHDGYALAALVEDYTLGHDLRTVEQRGAAVRRIRDLVARVGDGDAAAREGLATARLAGFRLPPRIDLREAAVLLSERRAALLDRPPTRLRVTAVLARGPRAPSPDRARAWARPLFEQARERLGETTPAVGAALGEWLLALQAPYRL